MTSGEGGMITTNDEKIADNCRVIRQHGMRRRYYHDELGFNFRMTDIHAAIGLAQLGKLERFNQIRRENAAFLSAHLHGVITPYTPPECQPVFHQYTVRVPVGQRDSLRAYLLTHEVGSEVYYPVPVHQQNYYTQVLGYSQSFPMAEQAAAEVLSIPVHAGLSQSDLDTIISAVNGFSQ